MILDFSGTLGKRVTGGDEAQERTRQNIERGLRSIAKICFVNCGCTIMGTSATIVTVGGSTERNGCRRSDRNRRRFRSESPVAVVGMGIWLAIAGPAAAQRVGDAPAHRVANTAPAAVQDVRFDLPVTNGLVLYLAADVIDGLDDGDPVAQWNDVSGSNHHALQNVSVQRPTYMTGMVSGNPGIRFDGTDDYLAVASFPFMVQWTLMVVFRAGPQGNWKGLAEFAQDATSRSGAGLNATDGRPLIAYPPGRFRVSTGNAVTNGQWHCLTVTFDGATPDLRLNGATQALGAQNTAGNANRFNELVIGNFSLYNNTYAFNGDIAEILAYHRALSDAERQAVEHYLGAKWLGW